jgi:MFS family permease
MTSPAASHVPPTALAADAREWGPPQRGLLFVLGFAAVGSAMAQLVPAVLTVAIRANEIDHANATDILSVAVGLGALFSFIGFPVFGRLSDRSVSRLGRRRPFLILGGVLFAIAAVVFLVADTVPLLVIGTVINMTGFAATTVAVTSVIPDQLAPHTRGPASAIVGLSLPVGAVLGLFVAQLVSASFAAMVLLPAAFGVVGSVLLGAVLRDRVQPRGERPGFAVGDLLRTFWVNPVKEPSFGLAWWSRILIFFGVGCVQVYQAFYLARVLGIDEAAVPRSLFLSTLVLTVTALVFAPIAAKISDRVQRRKVFVVLAAVVFAIGLVLVAVTSSFPMLLVSMAVIGFGQGIYFAVDLALVTQVLPDPDNPAKDLGIMNLTAVLPQAIVPAVGPAVLLIGASSSNPQNYPALFVLGAIAGLVGAALIIPITKVR